MRRVSLSLLLACTWLLVSTFVMYLTWDGSVFTWQTGSLFWPGSLIARASACGSVFYVFNSECLSDVLVAAGAKLWIAALSNLVFLSGVAYMLLAFLAKMKRITSIPRNLS
jgi:hypothetical protein